MNSGGKNPGQPGDGNRRPSPKSGTPRHGGHPRGAQSQPNRGQRDSATLGVRDDGIKKSLPSKDCALCGKPIFDLAGAVSDKDSGEPVHFDCALERVTAAESLQEGEKIVYLGAGCFGVVKYKNGTEGAFVVQRRIRWEKEGEKQPWRREISSYITKI
jgi:hypothetical protein